MSHFGIGLDEVLHDIPYALVVVLSSSVPRYNGKDKKDEPKDINEILMNQINTEK